MQINALDALQDVVNMATGAGCFKTGQDAVVAQQSMDAVKNKIIELEGQCNELSEKIKALEAKK